LKRWSGIAVDDNVASRFKQRLLGTLQRSGNGDWLAQNPEVDEEVAIRLGHPLDITPHHLLIVGDRDRRNQRIKAFGATYTFELIKAAKDVPRLVFIAQCLLWETAAWDSDRVGQMTADIQRAIELSPGLRVRLVSDEGSPELIPRGVKALDKALADEPQVWLDGHPTAQERFGRSLRLLGRNDAGSRRRGLMSMRKALQAILREVVGARGALSHQIEPLRRWLVENGVTEATARVTTACLERLTEADSQLSGHDSSAEIECEYLAYGAGALVRLVMRLSQSPPAWRLAANGPAVH